MDYLSLLRTGDTRLLEQLSNTGRANIEVIFKGLPDIPEYVEDATSVAGWDIRYQNTGNKTLGYYIPLSKTKGSIALLKGEETWMSLTPLEIESHLLPLFSAKGHTVVAGLGLGMISLNLLAKQAVKKLTILEFDAELIERYSDLLAGNSKELWEASLKSGRLEVIQCDCRQTFSKDLKQHLGRVDYLWVDIWPMLCTKEALIDTRFLIKQIKPRICDYWGMEIDLIDQMRHRKLSPQAKNIKKIVYDMGFVTSFQNMNKLQKSTYSDLVMMAAANMVLSMELRDK